MWTGIQIETYLIPKSVWENGHTFQENDRLMRIESLSRPARDASDIEQRILKKVNVRNEARRYTLCCERLQELTVELYQHNALKNPPDVWVCYDQFQKESVRALALLALVEQIYRQIASSRVGAVFTGPDQISTRLKSFKGLSQQEYTISELCETAARISTNLHPDLPIETHEVERAFERRYEQLSLCVTEQLGLVDVIDIV